MRYMFELYKRYVKEHPLSPHNPLIQRRLYDIGTYRIETGRRAFFDTASEGVDSTPAAGNVGQREETDTDRQRGIEPERWDTLASALESGTRARYEAIVRDGARAAGLARIAPWDSTFALSTDTDWTNTRLPAANAVAFARRALGSLGEFRFGAADVPLPQVPSHGGGIAAGHFGGGLELLPEVVVNAADPSELVCVLVGHGAHSDGWLTTCPPRAIVEVVNHP